MRICVFPRKTKQNPSCRCGWEGLCEDSQIPRSSCSLSPQGNSLNPLLCSPCSAPTETFAVLSLQPQAATALRSGPTIPMGSSKSGGGKGDGAGGSPCDLAALSLQEGSSRSPQHRAQSTKQPAQGQGVGALAFNAPNPPGAGSWGLWLLMHQILLERGAGSSGF